MLTQQSLMVFLRASGCPNSTSSHIWDKIRGYYQGRPYHNWNHIEHGWDLLEQPEVREYSHCHLGLLGGWLLHDAIYDPTLSDNEAQSAKLARDLYLGIGMEQTLALAAENFILATDHRHQPIGKDQSIIADVDLAELAVDWQLFQINTQRIREEYSFVPDLDFKKGRARVLQSFLDRKTIFKTPYFHERFEEKARDNLARSVKELQD